MAKYSRQHCTLLPQRHSLAAELYSDILCQRAFSPPQNIANVCLATEPHDIFSAADDSQKRRKYLFIYTLFDISVISTPQRLF
jgi:hypothetical protein